MRTRTLHFNMVEVLLALGVIAIGAVSVLGLFPYGFAANRDSMAESFAGDSADQFLHWFAAQARTNWTTYTDSATWLPTTKPAIPAAGDKEVDDWKTSVNVTQNLLYRQHDNDAGVLNVTFRRGDDDQPIVDFNSVYRIWRNAVTVPYLKSDGSSDTHPLNTDSALAINLEASWPAEIPYDRRQKAVYRLEVFRSGP